MPILKRIRTIGVFPVGSVRLGARGKGGGVGAVLGEEGADLRDPGGQFVGPGQGDGYGPDGTAGFR
jgi:hypothetical protein